MREIRAPPPEPAMNIRRQARPERPDAGASGLNDVEAEAAQWVVRRRAGLSAAAEQELTAWLAGDLLHCPARSGLVRQGTARLPARPG